MLAVLLENARISYNLIQGNKLDVLSYISLGHKEQQQQQ